MLGLLTSFVITFRALLGLCNFYALAYISIAFFYASTTLLSVVYITMTCLPFPLLPFLPYTL